MQNIKNSLYIEQKGLNEFLKRHDLSVSDIIQRIQPSDTQEYFILSNGMTLEFTNDKTEVILSDLLKENPNSGYSQIIDIGIPNLDNDDEDFPCFFILQETLTTKYEDEESHRLRVDKILEFFENREVSQDFFWTLSQPNLDFNDIEDIKLKEDLIRVYNLTRHFVPLINAVNENIDYSSLILKNDCLYLRSPFLIFSDFNPTTGKIRKNTRENFPKEIINEDKWQDLCNKYCI